MTDEHPAETTATTDEQPAPDPAPTAQDKVGNTIAIGDTVELYYGGDRHEAIVTDITSEYGLDMINAQVLALAPSGAVTKVTQAAAAADDGATENKPRRRRSAQ